MAVLRTEVGGHKFVDFDTYRATKFQSTTYRPDLRMGKIFTKILVRLPIRPDESTNF